MEKKTATQEAMESLETAVRARIPVIGVQTTEEAKVLALVREMSARPTMSLLRDNVATTPERIVLRWTYTGGVEVLRPEYLSQDGQVMPLPESLEERYREAEAFWASMQKTNQPHAAVHDYITWATAGGPEAKADQASVVRRASVLVMHDLHRFLGAAGGTPDPASIRALRDLFYGLLETKSYAIITAPDLSAVGDSGQELLIIDWPLPDVQELAALVRVTADKVDIPVGDSIRNGGAETLAQTMAALTWTQANFVLRQAIVRARELSVEKCGPLISAMKAGILKKQQGIELIEPEPITDMAGLDLLKKAVQHYPKFQTQAAQAAHVRPPRAILFCGPAGTGKSLACKTIGAGLLPILRWSPAESKDMYLGNTAKNVRGVLSAADAIGNCVLWLDEIDLLFPEGEGGRHETSAETQQMLLTWMQERKSRVIVAATTNHPNRLPAPLRDRFEDRWFVDLPRNTSDALAVFAVHLGKRGLGELAQDEAVELAKLAAYTVTHCLNPRGVEQAIEAAMRTAWGEDRPLVIADIESEIRRRKPGQATIDRINQMREESAWAMPASSATPDPISPQVDQMVVDM